MRTLLLALLGLTFAAPSHGGWNAKALSAQAQRFQGRFPKVQGRTLAKTDRQYPSGFFGSLNLVFLGFKRAHQRSTESWYPLAKKLRQTYPGLDQTSMPVLGGFTGLFKYFIINGMRKKIKVRSERLRMALVFESAAKFRKALKLKDTRKTTVVLTDRKGRIFWMARGSKTAALAKSLRQTLKKLAASPPRRR